MFLCNHSSGLPEQKEKVKIMKYGFGIDLGGTTVKIAYFDENGNILPVVMTQEGVKKDKL